MNERILIISSYNGPRRCSNISNSELLKIQFEQLNKLEHHLDKIVIVQNESESYPKELELFENVLYRENKQGSYGAWLHGYKENPDYNWYFFIEDDYVFVHDNFDQLMIDLWDDETSYLCSRLDNNEFGLHASIANGLTRGNILKEINLNGLVGIHAYETDLQVTFSRIFNSVPCKKMKGMQDKYCFPFWPGMRFVDDKPILLAPVQWFLEKEKDES